MGQCFFPKSQESTYSNTFIQSTAAYVSPPLNPKLEPSTVHCLMSRVRGVATSFFIIVISPFEMLFNGAKLIGKVLVGVVTTNLDQIKNAWKKEGKETYIAFSRTFVFPFVLLISAIYSDIWLTINESTNGKLEEKPPLKGRVTTATKEKTRHRSSRSHSSSNSETKALKQEIETLKGRLAVAEAPATTPLPTDNTETLQLREQLQNATQKLAATEQEKRDLEVVHKSIIKNLIEQQATELSELEKTLRERHQTEMTSMEESLKNELIASLTAIELLKVEVDRLETSKANTIQTLNDFYAGVYNLSLQSKRDNLNKVNEYVTFLQEQIEKIENDIKTNGSTSEKSQQLELFKQTLEGENFSLQKNSLLFEQTRIKFQKQLDQFQINGDFKPLADDLNSEFHQLFESETGAIVENIELLQQVTKMKEEIETVKREHQRALFEHYRFIKNRLIEKEELLLDAIETDLKTIKEENKHLTGSSLDTFNQEYAKSESNLNARRLAVQESKKSIQNETLRSNEETDPLSFDEFLESLKEEFASLLRVIETNETTISELNAKIKEPDESSTSVRRAV